jgi:PEP-CTERM motif
MRTKTFLYVVIGILFSVTQAFAVTYTYRGVRDTLNGNSYITATVNLNCAGPCPAGQYLEGGDLTAFTINLFSGADVLLASIGTSSIGYAVTPVQNYLTLGSAGNVISWVVTAYLNNVLIDTVGNDTYFYDEEDGIILGTYYHQLYASQHGPGFGTWSFSPSAVPLPAALPLFASGLGAIGLLGWRRKRKKTAAMAAA